MITIAAIPKPFHGHTGIIQNNAIESWTRLTPHPEILLFGDDEGTEETARRLGARHLPISRNEFGTPILGELFAEAPRQASNRLVCYVNSDIILLPDFLEMVQLVSQKKRRFLLVGQRSDLDITQPLDFHPGWQDQLSGRVKSEGVLYGPEGIDFFVFPRETDFQMPPFVVGRPNWDNWLIYRARAMGLPVIDATPTLAVVHQKHGYKHVPAGDGLTWEGPEGRQNLKLAQGEDFIFTLEDATHELIHGRIRLKLSKRHWELRKLRLATLHPGLKPYLKFYRSIKAALGLSKPSPNSSK